MRAFDPRTWLFMPTGHTQARGTSDISPMDAAGMQQLVSTGGVSTGLALVLLVPFLAAGAALWMWGRKVLRVSVGLGGLICGGLLGLGLAQLQGGAAASLIGAVLGAAAGLTAAIVMFRFTTALMTGLLAGLTTFSLSVSALIDLPKMPGLDPAAMQSLTGSLPGMQKLEGVTKQFEQLEQAKGKIQELQAAQAAGDTDKLMKLAQGMQQTPAENKPVVSEPAKVEQPGILKRIENNYKTAQSGLDVQSRTASDGKRHVVIRSKDDKQSGKPIQLASASEPGVPSSMVVDPGAIFAGTPMDMPQFSVPWGKLSVCVVLALVVGIGAMVACIEYHRKAVCVVSATLGAALLTSALSAGLSQLGGPSVGWIVWLVCTAALAAAGAFLQLRKLPAEETTVVKEKRSRNKFAVSAEDIAQESRFNPLARAAAAQRSSCATAAPVTPTDSGDPFREA